MSRFANPENTALLTLPGECQCPGKPHESDWIKMRTSLGGRDVVRLAAGDSVAAIKLLATEWNLLDDDGQPAPLDAEHIELLFSENFHTVDDWIEEHVDVGPLPNASAAPSPKSSRGSGSRTRTVRRGSSSTTRS